MLVRFFDHGKVKKGEQTRTGGGGAVRQYLLFDKNDNSKPRKGARLIYGNDIDTTEIINGIKNTKIYTSGVLSFAPEESITEAQKIEIIESFERNLFPGLMRGEYSGYWVEHKDKHRQELHFVFADIHLPTGKALPVFYHGKDLKLVDSWKELINIDYGLEDPNDPKRQRAYRLKGYEYALKKQQEKPQANDKLAGQALDNKNVFDEEKIGEWLIEEILEDESIQSQADVIRVIGETFEITRVAKDGKSISIKNPAGGRNIKLKGMMYEREFSRERFESLGKTQTSKRTNRSELQAINQREREKRQLRLEQRFAKHRDRDRPLEQELGREVTEFKSSANPRSPEPDRFTQSGADGFGSEHHSTVADGGNADRQYNNHGDERADRIGSNGQRREPESHYPSPNGVTDTAAASRATQSANRSTNRTDGHSPSATTQASKQVRSKGDDGYPVRNFSRCQFIWVKLLSGQPGLSNPATVGYATSPYQSNAYRGSGIIDGQYLRERRQSGWGTDNTQESANRILGQQSAGGENLARDRAGLRQKHNATEERQTTAVESYESANHYRTHHQAFTDVVERFASDNRPQTQSSQGRATSPAQSSDFTVSDNAVTAAIDQVIDPSRPADTSQDPATQSANQRLLERIGQATEVRNSNTEKRARRISAFTNQDTISLDQVREHTTRRRQRARKVADRFTAVNSDITEQYLAEQQRAARLRNYRRRVRSVKDNLTNEGHRIDQVTTGLGQFAVAVSAVVKAVIELFKRLFNGLKQQIVGYAKEGVLYGVDADGKQHPLNQQQAESYVSSHPYDLSGYAQLTLTAKKLEKDKELRHEPVRGFGR